jgi:hypothetical protein
MLALIFSSMIAHAAQLNCEFTEGGTLTKTTNVSFVEGGDNHGVVNFETAYTTGFISISRGFGVVNLVSKADPNVIISFYGDLSGGQGFGGNSYLNKDQYIETTCKQ